MHWQDQAWANQHEILSFEVALLRKVLITSCQRSSVVYKYNNKVAQLAQPFNISSFRRPCSPPALRQVVIQATSSSSFSSSSSQSRVRGGPEPSPPSITNNKLYRQPEEESETGLCSRTSSFPPSRPRGLMRSQQSCPEPPRPSHRPPISRQHQVTKQKTPPPIPARRRLPPPNPPV